MNTLALTRGLVAVAAVIGLAWFGQSDAESRPSSSTVEGRLPPLAGTGQWLNSRPMTNAELEGKVVLVYFWTFGCSNCKNALPHVSEWHRRFKDQGLVVIGVHSPEFAYEADLSQVKRALVDLKVSFPVLTDNQFSLWRAFGTQAWPTWYLMDAKGQIRFQHIGEGQYLATEQAIQQALDDSTTLGTATSVR